MIRAGGPGIGVEGAGATCAGAGGVGVGSGTGGTTVGCGGGVGAGAGGVGAVVVPGIGELPGGITGFCPLPVGNTGAAGGRMAVGCVGVPGGVGAGASAGDAFAGGGGTGTGSPPIVAGGPVNAMLLCVPM